MEKTVIVTVKVASKNHAIKVRRGTNLRKALLEAGLSPYRGVFQGVNCGGLGVCGTCRVKIREGEALWDRLSCQIRLFQDIETHLQ